MEENRKLIQTIIEGIQEKKGKKIVTVDLTKIESSSAQYFIICQGGSPMQVAAIAGTVRDASGKHVNPEYSYVYTLIPEAESAGITVYNLQGILMLQTDDAADLKTLQNGAYIVNGKKMIIVR